MIDYIKNNFKEGDYLSITGSGSRINGTLIYIDNRLVVLRTLSGAIEGIKADAIVSFSTQARDKYSVRRDNRDNNISQQTTLRQTEPIHTNPITNTSTDSDLKGFAFRQFKPGDKIPLDELTHRDPSLTHNWRLKRETKARSSALQEELLTLLDSTSEGSTLQENLQTIKSMGKIVELNPCFHFGFIDDLGDGQRYFFNKFDLVDDELKYAQGKEVEVIYLRTTNRKGVAAKCVHRPTSAAQLLDLVKEMIKKEEFQNAKYIVQMILNAYPQNQIARCLADAFEQASDDLLPANRNPESNAEMYSYYKEGKKKLVEKDQRGAIQAFQMALSGGYRKSSCIKDISQAYISLYTGTEDEYERKRIRTEALDFMAKHRSELPKNQSTLFTLENFYFALGDYQQHIDVVKQVIVRCAEEGELAQYVFYQNKAAQCYIRLGELNKALDATTHGLEVDPEHTNLLKTRHAIMEAMKGNGLEMKEHSTENNE